MKLSIVVLTPDKRLSSVIGVKKTGLIPSDIRKKYPNISIGSFVLQPATTVGEAATFFARSVSPGIVVLCDNRFAHLVPGLATSLFTVTFDHSFGSKNVQNYFWMILSKIIREFLSFAPLFDDEKSKKLLILPLRNLSADELRQLHDLFRNGVIIDGNLRPSVDRLLSTLRGRRKPKVTTTRSKTFYVDDAERFFEYGRQIHARLETARPPHNEICAVAGIYRFGKQYDVQRHFNVSREGQDIQGSFRDCHGSTAARGPCSHINMFPNDFFG
jgi:hypothetical protein